MSVCVADAYLTVQYVYLILGLPEIRREIRPTEFIRLRHTFGLQSLWNETHIVAFKIHFYSSVARLFHFLGSYKPPKKKLTANTLVCLYTFIKHVGR